MSAMKELGDHLRGVVFDGGSSHPLVDTIMLAATKVDEMSGTIAGVRESGGRSSHLIAAELAFSDAATGLESALGAIAAARDSVNLFFEDTGLPKGQV